MRIRLFEIVSWDFLSPLSCLIFLFTAFDGVDEFRFDTRVGEDGECRAVDTIVLSSAGKVKEAAAAPVFFFFCFHWVRRIQTLVVVGTLARPSP